jgi:hypothetical protein
MKHASSDTEVTISTYPRSTHDYSVDCDYDGMFTFEATSDERTLNQDLQQECNGVSAELKIMVSYKTEIVAIGTN